MIRNSFARTVFVTGIAITAIATGCKPGAEESDVSGTGDAVAFPAFCKTFKLTKCNVSPADAKVEQRDWELGVDIFRELLNSSTTINVARSEMDIPVVRDMFNTFGAQSLMSFIKSIPWQTMSTDIGSIVLTSAGASQSVKVNGLTFIAEQKVVIKSGRTRAFSVTGLSIADADGKNPQKVLNIDMATAGRIHLTTDKQRITDFPVSFFTIDGLVNKVTLSASSVMKTVTAMATDKSFDWRQKATIILNNGNLVKLLDISNEAIPESSPFGATFETVVRKAKTLIIGGTSNMLLAVSLNAPIKCTMKFINIPLLGSKDIALDFATGFGVNNLVKTASGSSTAQVYGITTGLGAIQNAEIVGGIIKLKVGPLTIPLDMDKQAGGGGVQLKGITCQ